MPITQRFIDVGDSSTAQPIVPITVQPGQSVAVTNQSGSSLNVLQAGLNGGATNTLTSGQSVTLTNSALLQSQGVTGVLITRTDPSPVNNQAGAMLAARGLISETMSPAAFVGTGVVVASQQIWCSLLGLTTGDPVTNICVCVATAAAGTTPTTIKLALVRKDGLVLGTTANVTADAKWTTTGYKSFALTSPVVAPVTDGYYVALLEDGVFGTTPLQVVRVGSTLTQTGTAIGGGARLFALGGTSQTDITGTLTLADPSTGQSVWFGVS